MNETTVITTTNILGRIVNVYGTYNEPIFLAKDVAEWLGLTNVTDMISRVEPFEVTKLNLGGLQGECNMLTEDGLYEILMQSRKPIAKEFKLKVKQYIREIRKFGATALNPEDLLDPDFIISIATQLKVERARIALLESQNNAKDERLLLQDSVIKESAPKVMYFDEVLQSDSLFSTTVIAKELGMSATSLNKKLHEMKVIYWTGESWVLYQKYQDKGYTGTRTSVYTNSIGISKTAILTVWSEKGRNFIHGLFKNDQEWNHAI